MSERPLHPNDQEDLFQHPIEGMVWDYQDHLMCLAKDQKAGELLHQTDLDQRIYVGVEVFRARCELGDWLTKVHPDDEHKTVNHLFVEAVLPCDFSGDNAESTALLGRIDLAANVVSAGGACTICGEPNDGAGRVIHAVGCELISWAMYEIVQTRLSDREPTLSEVVEAAHAQIQRMQ